MILIKKIATLLYRFFLMGIGVSISNCIVWFSRIAVIKGNHVYLNSGFFLHSKVDINGTNNCLINNGYLRKVSIKITGTDNIIEFEDVKIDAAHIVLRGDRCHIIIRKGTTVGSMYMVCMGKNNSIDIGENCMIAENVDIWNTDSHPIYNEQGTIINKSKKIVVGKHVWLGKGSRILKGVTIGDNAVVGMGALVTKNIPPSSLNAGTPTRIIKSNINWDRNFIRI